MRYARLFPFTKSSRECADPPHLRQWCGQRQGLGCILIRRLRIKGAVRRGYCPRFRKLLLDMKVTELGFQLYYIVDCVIYGEKSAMSSGQVF